MDVDRVVLDITSKEVHIQNFQITSTGLSFSIKKLCSRRASQLRLKKREIFQIY